MWASLRDFTRVPKAALPPSLRPNPRNPRGTSRELRAARTTTTAASLPDAARASAEKDDDVMDSLTRSRTHGSRVSVSHGEDALRSYLAWDGHARAAHMDPDAFASWLEQSVLQYLTANRASLLRARADGVRKLHAPTLDPLTHALERAEAAYASSAEGARIERATHAVAHRRAAVIGIEAFLDKDRSRESPEMANKQTSARAKLTDARASLPLAERELADAVASSPLWRAREAARTAVTAEREATGLAAADKDAREASTAGGNSLVTKGDDYEKTCADVVMAMLRDDPTGGTLGLDLGGSSGAEASSDKGAGLLLLRNVTLGLHSGELDCVLVRVNRESAFVDTIPQDGDGTTGRRTLIRRGRTRTADDEVEDEKKPPAAEVLAVFEFKRNPDDVARGFHSRQTTLGWLAGDERSYDAGEWRNRRHPSGHFNRGYHPMKATSWVSAEKFPETSGCDQKGRRAVVLTRDSFRGFRRHGGFYLDGVWLVTRPRTMCGLDAKLRAPLMEIAGSHVSSHVVQSMGGVPSPEAFHAAVETLRRTRTPSNDDDPLRAKLRTLHAWLAKAVREKNVAVPNDTVGVLELYLDAGEATARRVMLVEQQPDPR